MDKEELLSIFEDILNFSGYYIDVVDVVKPNRAGEGYKLRLKGRNLNSAIQRIHEVVQLYDLQIREENGVVIY